MQINITINKKVQPVPPVFFVKYPAINNFGVYKAELPGYFLKHSLYLHYMAFTLSIILCEILQ